MELLSNLVWAIVAAALLQTAYSGVRRGAVRLPMASAMSVALLTALILLPVISVSDDLLAQRQAALPASSQTWKMAADNFSAGLDSLPTGEFALQAAAQFAPENDVASPRRVLAESVAMRLVRAQQLRPPLARA